MNDHLCTPDRHSSFIPNSEFVGFITIPSSNRRKLEGTQLSQSNGLTQDINALKVASSMMSGLVLCDPDELLHVRAIQMQDENRRVADSLFYVFQSLVRVTRQQRQTAHESTYLL